MSTQDPWAKYPKEVRESLKNNGAITDAIRNMKARGHDKEYAQQITGAPYEVVDRIYNDKTPHNTEKRGGEGE